MSRHDPGNPDAIYVYDPVLVGREGAVLLQPGKAGRRGEPAALAPALEEAGVPVAATLDGPALAEGGDTLWLDETTLLVGIGYRTNEEAVPALEAGAQRSFGQGDRTQLGFAPSDTLLFDASSERRLSERVRLAS